MAHNVNGQLPTAGAFAVSLVFTALLQAQSAPWKPPLTPWGDPDLQGTWSGTDFVGVPLLRPPQFGTRNILNGQEFEARVAQAARDTEADTADSRPERGQPTRQASMIVDPPDGQIPPMTAEGQQRNAALQQARRGRGPADSWTDRGIYDRCISRSVVGASQPSNGLEIVQAPGYVAVRIEMIHETRVIPLDGRPHVGSAIRTYAGDSRGRWDNNTLIVETTNFNGRATLIGNAGPRPTERVTLTERFRLIAPGVLQYQVTFDDPGQWTRPWTVAFQRKSDPRFRLFEYACHEGNYSMWNILSGARADERPATGR